MLMQEILIDRMTMTDAPFVLTTFVKVVTATTFIRSNLMVG